VVVGRLLVWLVGGALVGATDFLFKGLPPINNIFALYAPAIV